MSNFTIDDALEEYTRSRIQFASDIIIENMKNVIKNLENQLERERREHMQIQHNAKIE